MMMIEIVPIGNVDTGLLRDLCIELEKFFGACYVGEKAEIPRQGYNARRRQYDAACFLSLIGRRARDSGAEKLVGITSEDLYADNLNFVFGQAEINGKACVVSLRRLDPEFYGFKKDYRLLLERAVKEAIHELGHCYGLRHCEDKTCVMVFSNNIYEVDRKTRNFCNKCNDINKEVQAP